MANVFTCLEGCWLGHCCGLYLLIGIVFVYWQVLSGVTLCVEVDSCGACLYINVSQSLVSVMESMTAQMDQTRIMTQQDAQVSLYKSGGA